MATRLAAAEPGVREQVSPEEWQTRVDLACAYRAIAHHGWDDLIFTHLSARVPGPDEHFLINPIGLMFEEVTASSLVKVDLAGNIMLPTPHFINPAGFVIHSTVHGARHDVGAVFHTHSVAGVAVSCQEQGLLPASQIALNIFNEVAYHDYEGLALMDEERPRLVADLGTANALILRNHGLLTCGRTVAEAYIALFILEKACQIQVAALGNGAKLKLQGQAMADLVGQQAMTSFGFAAGLAWSAVVRKMDRLSPGFRD
jgi:ribulose-5-phosphate 4-epimerase/fuculose-1-phosphate aldolase